MYQRTDLIYLYDGSFDGLLCCVFRAIYQKEDPLSITAEEDAQASLLETVVVDTEPEKAARVRKSIPEKLGGDAMRILKLCFLSALPHKELAILAFLRLGYKTGPAVLRMLTHPQVYQVVTAARAVSGEAHLLKGFTRFSQYGGTLIAQIEPKNHVLPILAQHFRARMPGESFLIFDRTHQMAAAYSGGQYRIFPLHVDQLPRADRQEQFYRQLWTRFYDTISIEGRYNPKCRMTNMPKRYWGMMTEFQEENQVRALPENSSRISGKKPSKIPCEDRSGQLQ